MDRRAKTRDFLRGYRLRAAAIETMPERIEAAERAGQSKTAEAIRSAAELAAAEGLATDRALELLTDRERLAVKILYIEANAEDRIGRAMAAAGVTEPKSVYRLANRALDKVGVVILGPSRGMTKNGQLQKR